MSTCNFKREKSTLSSDHGDKLLLKVLTNMVCSSMYSSEHLYMPDPARIAPLEHSPHTETAHARGKTEPGFCPLRYEEYHYISMLRRLRNKQREHERTRKTFAYTDYTGMTISEETTAPNRTKPHVTQAVQQPRCLMRRLRASHPENAHAKHTKRTRDGFGMRVAGRKQ